MNNKAKEIVTQCVQTLTKSTGFPKPEEQTLYIDILLMEKRDSFAEEKYLDFLAAYQSRVSEFMEMW